MKTVFKRGLAAILAAVLVMCTTAVAFAADAGITLSINDKDDFYAGVTYEVTATATQIPANKLIEDTQSAFTWQLNGVDVISSNNYYYTENDNGTYDATESAKFTLPSQAGADYTLNVSYNDLFVAFKSFRTMQPITNISLTCVDSADREYLFVPASEDTGIDKLYIDNTKEAEFNASVYPLTHEDDMFVSSTATAGVVYSRVLGTNTFKLKVENTCKKDFDLSITPRSGYKYQKVVNVINSIALTGFELKMNGTVISGTSAYTSATPADKVTFGATKVMQDESFVVSPQKKNSVANDEFIYVLKNKLTNEIINEYYHVDENYNCSLNIHNPGTYELTCFAVSKGTQDYCAARNIAISDKESSILPRDLKSVLEINVQEENPITDICFVQEDGVTPLESIKLFVNTSQSTYNISNRVKKYPENHTNSIKYVSDNTAIATIDANGLITAKKSGTTRVFAVSDKNDLVFAVCEVNVVTGISSINNISAELDTLPAGHKEQLVAVATPAAHDEIISWSSGIPQALTIDKNGIATAVEDYDFGGSESVMVPVTATSQFGKTCQKYIKVVPAVRATSVEINVDRADGEAIKTDDNVIYNVYPSTAIVLSATAVDKNMNESNDKLVWQVCIDNGAPMLLDDIGNSSTLKVVKPTVGNNTYTITPQTNATFVITCTAIRNGEVITAESVFDDVIIKSIPKATRLATYIPGTATAYGAATLPEKSTTDIEVIATPFEANESDPVSFYSEDPTVATVEQTGYATARITTLKKGSTYIVAKSESGTIVRFMVTVTNTLDNIQLAGLEDSYEYTGRVIQPTFTVMNNGTVLSPTFYTVTYANNINVGTATITIAGRGDFLNAKKVFTFDITPKVMNSDYITVTNSLAYYTLTDTVREALATFTVMDTVRNAVLVSGKDYEISYIDNNKAGTATAIIKGINNYAGSVQGKFVIKDQATRFTVASIGAYTYDGKPKTPTPKVTYLGRTLKLGTDYTLTYGANVAIGTASVVITGMGNNFVGVKIVEFTINPPTVKGFKSSAQTNNSITLSWTADPLVTGYQIYDASTNKLVKTVTTYTTASYKKGSLSAAKLYKFKIRTYKTINGKNYYGPFSGVISVYTKPVATTISSVSAGSKRFTVKWKKQTTVTGYQIQYSTSSKFSGAKTVTIGKNATVSKVVTGLKAKKKYYVRIRTYKKISGKTYYSAWSKSKAVTTK